MKSYFQSSPAARLFFLVVSLNIWLGIWRTGGSTSPPDFCCLLPRADCAPAW